MCFSELRASRAADRSDASTVDNRNIASHSIKEAKEKSCGLLIADRLYALDTRETHSPVKCWIMHSRQREAVGEPRLLQLRLGCERRIDPNWKPEIMVQQSRNA